MTSLYAPECESLAAIAAGARQQLDALRDGTPDRFEAASALTLDAVADLDRRRRDRARRTAGGERADDRAVLEAAAREAHSRPATSSRSRSSTPSPWAGT